MIDSCIKRTDASFQNHLKKGILLNPTDYIVPTEICAMINVVLDAKNQSFKLCAVDGVDVVSFHFRNGDQKIKIFWIKIMQNGKPKEEAKEKKVNFFTAKSGLFWRGWKKFWLSWEIRLLAQQKLLLPSVSNLTTFCFRVSNKGLATDLI